MPVSGNEEPGVLARQSSNPSSGIPIKKRWYSMVQLPSPPRPLSNQHESEIKDPGLTQGSTFNLPDTGNNSLLEMKQERSVADVVPHPALQSVSRETSSSSLRDINEVKPAVPENVASEEAVVTELVKVKKEVVPKQGESLCKLELSPADSGHVELSLGLKEPPGASLVAQNTEGRCCLIPETVNPSLLSLSLNKTNDMSQDGQCNKNDVDDTKHPNRSNWDLNTPMDSWEGAGDDVPVQDSSRIELLRKTPSELDRKPSSSSTSGIGSKADKGKQVVEASEQEFNFPIPPLQPDLPFKSLDVLRLSLGSTLRGFDSTVRQSSTKVDCSKFSPNSGLLKNLGLNINVNSPTSKTVKSEPVEETTSVRANAGTVCCPAGTVEANVAKTELEKQSLQSIELSSKGPQKLLEQKLVKCEPPQEFSREICMTSDVMEHQSVRRGLQLQESCSSSSSTLPMPLTPQKGCPSRLSNFSDLSVSGDLSIQSEYSVHTNEAGRSKNAPDLANANIAATNANFDLRETNVSSDKVEVSVLEDMNIEGHMVQKVTGDRHHFVASGDGSANDEEKISISAGTEEECYGSDYESDGNHALAGHVDTERVRCGRENEEYEDGEVREPTMPLIVEDSIAEGMDSETNIDSVSENAHPAGFSGVGESPRFNNDKKDDGVPLQIETNDDFVKGCDEKFDKIYQIYQEVGNLQSSLLEKVETTGTDEQRPIDVIQQEPLDQSGITEVQKEGSEKDVLCDAEPTGTNVGEANYENIGGSDTATTLDSSLQNPETSVNANSFKDFSNAGSKSRIINLPRASNVTSPSNMRNVAGRSLSYRSGRDRYFDMEEDKFHSRRNRDGTYSDGPKFVGNRIHDRPFGSSRGNFMRGRGRGSARFDSSRSEWDCGRDFESYGGVADFRFRRKRTAVGESEIERNDYDNRLDGAAFASNRRRKPLNDGLPSFRHPPARRLSPNIREDGAAMMGNQMLHRAPRNISPGGVDGSELVGLRHSDKFVRDFADDISDPVYSHQQSVYDGADGHFVRGNNTKFTTMQRRGFPRARSKSPVRSPGTRSPGAWRLTEGFNSGLPDSSQHRMYREDRMRPSSRTFTEEMVPRRRESPSYAARRLNDMNAVQDPRSLPSRRSPPERAFTRSNRRPDMLDRRERADGDDYFGGPVHAGRFPDERRKYGERRGGSARAFRPSYNNDSENDNFRFHPDDGPRPFRFYPEADAEFVERSSSNTREREFDANMKDRPLPRRIRNVEEQEGNFRQSGQVWHEEEFDVSRLKRRRF